MMAKNIKAHLAHHTNERLVVIWLILHINAHLVVHSVALRAAYHLSTFVALKAIPVMSVRLILKYENRENQLCSLLSNVEN